MPVIGGAIVGRDDSEAHAGGPVLSLLFAKVIGPMPLRLRVWPGWPMPAWDSRSATIRADRQAGSNCWRWG